jgi:hypothetical protein
MTDGVASPCVNICELDETKQWCLGCGRSLSEIAAWSTSNDEQKRGIIQDIERRRLGRSQFAASVAFGCLTETAEAPVQSARDLGRGSVAEPPSAKRTPPVRRA